MKEATLTVNLLKKDALTGLLNKEGFYHNVHVTLSDNPQTEYDLIVMDLDRFKLINDTYGVKEGNKLLKYVADELSAYTDDKDGVCARANADQFMILMARDEKARTGLMDCMCEKLNHFPVSMKIRCKFGIYEIDDRTLEPSAMCDRAILAVREIKGKYDALFSYYDDKLRKQMLLEQQIMDDMEGALTEGQFQVYLQPKVNLDKERIGGAEALVRWIHPVHGFMSPGDFIPVFEKNGFITELDTFVWEKTCGIIEGWIKNGLGWVPVSVNVSRKDIYSADLPLLLKDMIDRHGLKPEMLHLEITETAYTEDSNQLVEVVDELRALGFIIEMDDFGSGYSSLNMISELPINILKLDMKFMQSKQKPEDMKNIMRFVIELAKTMKLSVIAEGVETKEQVSMLKELGCDFAQGYFYSRPVPADNMTQMLEKQDEK